MCGRFASFLPPQAVRALFRTTNPLPNAAPTWNLAPTQAAMVVRRHPETGERHLDELRWGLVPHFTKDLKAARKPINARSETAATSGMFRGALAQRRCLVPADAFYEWRAMPDGKQPYAIARRDGSPLAFAGIWEGWRSPEGETLRTFAILTTAANATMRQLHDRMPVILEAADWPAWLGEGGADPLALAHSGHRDQPIRLIVITRTGDHDHVARRGRWCLAGSVGGIWSSPLTVVPSHFFWTVVKHLNRVRSPAAARWLPDR